MLRDIDSYTNVQAKVADLMSKGIFQMAMARQYDRSCKQVVDSLRQDIDAKITLAVNEEGRTVAEEVADAIDPLYYFSGIPSRNARNAQSAFAEVLQLVVELSDIAKNILSILPQPRVETLEEGD